MKNNQGSFKERCMHCLQDYWSGEASAVRRGYDCLYRQLRFYVHSGFRNLLPDQKLDAIQISLLKIHQARTGKPVGDCSGFVRKLTRNVCIDLWRKEQCYQEQRVDEETLAFDGSENAHTSADASQRLQQQIALEDIAQFLAQDSGGEDDLAIITGLVEGESYESLGQQLGRSKGAVATRVVVIRKKLESFYRAVPHISDRLLRSHFPADGACPFKVLR